MVFECVMIENAELLFLMNDEPSVMVEDREACVVRHLAPEKFFFFFNEKYVFTPAVYANGGFQVFRKI